MYVAGRIQKPLGYLCLSHSGNICKGKQNVNHLQPHPRRQVAQSGPEQKDREELTGSVPEKVPGETIWISLHVQSRKGTLLRKELVCHTLPAATSQRKKAP